MRYQLAVTVSTHRLDCLYTHGSQDHWTKCKKITAIDTEFCDFKILKMFKILFVVGRVIRVCDVYSDEQFSVSKVVYSDST